MREFEKYLKQSEFTDYEDFRKNFEIKVPENFNFAYDVLDALAEKSPDKPALLWVSEDMQRERTVTFAEMSALSKRAANMFSSLGIKKGDRVMLILKRHIEFWICTMAFCRIGAAVIPATHQLQEKDIVYRVNMAGKGWEQACRENEELRKGLNIVDGKVVYKPVAEAWGLPYTELSL